MPLTSYNRRVGGQACASTFKNGMAAVTVTQVPLPLNTLRYDKRKGEATLLLIDSSTVLH